MTKRFVKIAGALLMPLGLVLLDVSFRFPETTESVYSQGLYPSVARAFAALNRAPFSFAELLSGSAIVALAAGAYFGIRRTPSGRRAKAVLAASWMAAGLLLWSFLVLWGLNYARPPLEERLGLTDGERVAPEALLDAARRVAAETSSLYSELGVDEAPSRLPMSFDELDRVIDEGYRSLRLPGDAIVSRTTPAKRLASSTLFSYLGISGIFIPFTGEPSVNALQPDVTLPMVLAHEKAHQRGITREGEANFAAFLVCARDEAPAYLRYSAYLFAAQYLVAEASRHFPREDVLGAWDLLGEGAKADARAIREFWRRYEGGASEVASRVNDGYLRAFRVPDGAHSYGTVVRMLLALDQRGELLPEKW